ncbi:hypothetical protein COBT_003533 [Conglomerata obtusa]
MKNIIAYEEINILESKNKITLKTYKKKYIFFFFIQIKKKELLTEQNIKVFFLIKTISIYYTHNARVKLYGRYVYKDNYVFEDCKIKAVKILSPKIVTGQNLFSKFKNQLDVLSDYTFSLLTGFLPTKKCFLNFVNYIYCNGRKTFPLDNYNPQNINLVNLEILLNAIKTKHSLISEIVLFDAEIIKKDNFINLAYKENLLNIVEICNELKVTDLNEEMLRNIRILIILLDLKGVNGNNSNYYIFLPIKEYDFIRKIIYFNEIYKAYANVKFKDIIDDAQNKADFKFLIQILTNILFILPKSYIHNFIKFNSLNHVLCEKRILLYILLAKIISESFTSNDRKQLKLIYQNFKQNRYSESDLIMHRTFLKLKTDMKDISQMKSFSDALIDMLKDINLTHKRLNKTLSDVSPYLVHQSNVSVPNFNTAELCGDLNSIFSKSVLTRILSEVD